MDRCRRFYDQQLNLATPRQWNALVPRAILEEVARAHGGDRAGGKLTAPVHFWVLVVASLSKGCSSLKDLLSPRAARPGHFRPWRVDPGVSQTGFHGGRSRRLAAPRRRRAAPVSPG
jgi:hypothetical protein